MNPFVRGIITPIIKNYIKKNPKVIKPNEAAIALENILNKAVQKISGQPYSSTKWHISPASVKTPNPAPTKVANTTFGKIFLEQHPKRSPGDKFATKDDVRTALEGFIKKNPKFDFGGKEKVVATALNKDYQKLSPMHPSLITTEGKTAANFREVWNELKLPIYTASERGKLAAKSLPTPMRVDHPIHHPNLDAYTKQFLIRNHPELLEGSKKLSPEGSGIAEMIEQGIRRDNTKAYMDIFYGAGKNKKIKRQDLRKNLWKNVKNEKFMQKYFDEVYPYRHKAESYMVDKASEFGVKGEAHHDAIFKSVTDYMRARGMTDEQITQMLPTFFKTLGHKGPISASYLDFLRTTKPMLMGKKNKLFLQQLADMGLEHPSLKMWQAGAKPRMWEPEIGVANKAKDITDRIMFGGLQQQGLIYPSQLKGIDQMRRLYEDVGIESLIRGKPIGEGFNLAKQEEFIRKQVGRGHDIFTGPSGHTPADWQKLKRQWINMLLRGDRTYKDVLGFQAGGLVGIGSKILAKLVNKLSEKEMKMILGSLWKGVDRKQAPHYKAWAKNRWGPGYKWPWKKSRIRGPGIKKSHYASLSDEAKERLRERYAKRLAEYIARKKRGG